MKPKDLKIPFADKTWHLLIKNQIFYVPAAKNNETAFIFPSWEEIFGNTHPIKMEYCSGNGDWIVEKARTNPQYNWIALEKKYERVRKIWSKGQNYDLKNLFIISGEGFEVTTHFIHKNSLSEVFINFPDPWPKRRDHKHRIIQPLFLDALASVMQDKATLHIVTDDMPFSDSIIKIVNNNPSFVNTFDAPFFKVGNEDYGSSYFRELWESQGKEIRFHQFLKKTIV
jgi:tRNA (guanine-N7-)-methyltransferase